MLFLGSLIMLQGTLCRLVDDVIPLAVVLDHMVDGTPVGQSAQIAVVDEDIHLQFAREVRIVVPCLFGIVAIDSIELQSALPTPFDSLFQQFTLAHRPEDEPVSVLPKHLQRVYGKGYLLAYLWILMLY